MTKRDSRSKQQVGTLKVLLLAGSFIATLAGTRLLALQEPAGPETAVPAIEQPVTVVVPATRSSSILLPPTSRGASFNLKPIPQVVQPRLKPVVRTRSSR